MNRLLRPHESGGIDDALWRAYQILLAAAEDAAEQQAGEGQGGQFSAISATNAICAINREGCH